MDLNAIVGQPASFATGSKPQARAGSLGELIVSELHGKFYESNFRGNLYSIGMNGTALSANTTTLTATTTPIIGLWNPASSTVNAVISKASLQITAAGNSAVAPGSFYWATSIGNGAISTGLNPINRKTLAATGSQVKGFNITTALTGLTNSLALLVPSSLPTLVAAQSAPATPLIGGAAFEEFDGSLIIPPGGVLALLNQTSTTTVSVASQLIWEEVPLTV